MFDPRDISSDPRTLTPQRPKRDHLKERQERKRTGSRAEFDPRSGGEDFTSRTERAVAEIGMYRTVAYKDLSEAEREGADLMGMATTAGMAAASGGAAAAKTAASGGIK